MRDGTLLKADVYLPSKGEKSEKYACLLMRTPYGKRNLKHHYKDIGRLYAGQGIACVIQDVRGKYASEGDFYPHRFEGEDGEDTIKWIEKESWFNQKMALFGISYLGFTAWRASESRAPSIKTVLPWFTASSAYVFWHEQGVSLFHQTIYWMVSFSGRETLSLDEKKVKKTGNGEGIISFAERLSKKTIPACRDWVEHPKEDDFWRSLGMDREKINPAIPHFFVTGWYDQFSVTTIHDFCELQKISKDPSIHRLVVGPWLHFPIQENKSLRISKNAKFLKLFAPTIEWLKVHFGEISQKERKEESVSYYMVEKNRWFSAPSWPPPGVEKECLYFSQSSLKNVQPSSSKRTLCYNPQIQVPVYGGRMLYAGGEDGPYDQGFLYKREDVLFWRGEPLEKEKAVVGICKAVFYMQSSCLPFNLVVKLIDAAPGGSKKWITEGIAHVNESCFIKGEDYLCVEVVLSDIAYFLRKGHRIEVVVTHSQYPQYAPIDYPSDIKEIQIEFLEGGTKGSFIEISKNLFNISDRIY